MHVYCRPAAGVRMLSADQIEKAIRAAYHGIHSDVRNREVQLEQFVSQIADAYFS